ncbi:MAG TPA: replication protein [Acetivibrio sp.]|nr:replication protein [Acetivibrio sp.]
MARKSSSRKYQLTINNPIEHGFTHEKIKELLGLFPGIVYWCMCDEIGQEGTPHTHIYLVSKNAIMFQTIHKRFYGAHIEPALGSNKENRDYILKEGKWADDKKKETNLADTFEESGELPPERQAVGSVSEEVYEMIKQGASNVEIMEAFPSVMNRLDRIEQVRQTLIAEKYKNTFRKLEVTYIWGDSGAGKTRSVMEEYGYDKVFRVTNYEHPFDSYKSEDVIVFEEFRSSLKIEDMLNYLDGYPLRLPCRYADKVACYTKVYIITNIPLEEQYPSVQQNHPETWAAFLRRINYIQHMEAENPIVGTDHIIELI